MRTLRLEKYGKIAINGSLVDMNTIQDKPEFLKGLLLLDLELSDDIILGDIVHFFADMKDSIQSLLSEEYEIIRAMSISTKLAKPFSRIEIGKSFKVEDESETPGVEDNYIHLLPDLNFIRAEDNKGFYNLGELPVVINENITLKVSGKDVVSSKTKINLMDLMVCVFDELPTVIKGGSLFLS